MTIFFCHVKPELWWSNALQVLTAAFIIVFMIYASEDISIKHTKKTGSPDSD